MKDITSYEDIQVLVNRFYEQVREDELLAPVFREKIPGDWGPHLQIMYNFWYTVLLGKAAYRGNPFIKHVDLPIHKQHFDRWVGLFHQTVDALYAGNIANEAKDKASKMSILFQAKLNDARGGTMKPVF